MRITTSTLIIILCPELGKFLLQGILGLERARWNIISGYRLFTKFPHRPFSPSDECVWNEERQTYLLSCGRTVRDGCSRLLLQLILYWRYHNEILTEHQSEKTQEWADRLIFGDLSYLLRLQVRFDELKLMLWKSRTLVWLLTPCQEFLVTSSKSTSRIWLSILIIYQSNVSDTEHKL